MKYNNFTKDCFYYPEIYIKFSLKLKSEIKILIFNLNVNKKHFFKKQINLIIFLLFKFFVNI